MNMSLSPVLPMKMKSFIRQPTWFQETIRNMWIVTTKAAGVNVGGEFHCLLLQSERFKFDAAGEADEHG